VFWKKYKEEANWKVGSMGPPEIEDYAPSQPVELYMKMSLLVQLVGVLY